MSIYSFPFELSVGEANVITALLEQSAKDLQESLEITQGAIRRAELADRIKHRQVLRQRLSDAIQIELD